MKTRHWLLLLLLAFLLIEPASASTVMDSTVGKFQAAANVFGENIKSAGIRLLVILATIQIGWTVIQHLMKGAELTELIWIPVRTIFVFGFYFALIKGSANYLPQIIQSFDVLGQRGSGLGPLTPSDIISQGFDVSFSLLQSYKDKSSTLDLLTSPFAALIAAWCCIMICLCFVMIGAQMALALVSGYLWAAVTPFLLGFGSLSFTRDMANNALKGGVSVGMKIMCCYFVAGVAAEIAPMLGEELAQPSVAPKISAMLICGSSVALLAYLSFQLPKLASDLLNGTASLSAGDAATNMAGMAAMAVGAGAMAGAAGGAIKDGVSSALSKAGAGSISGGGGGLGGLGGGEAGGGGGGAAVEPPADSGGAAAAVEPPADLGSAAGASIGGGGGGSSDKPRSSLAKAMDAARSTHSAIHQITPNDSHAVGMNATIGRGD